MSDRPKPPKGAGPAGRRLWASVLAEYDFEQHELALLTAMVRTVDVLEQLQVAIDRDGVLSETGAKPHPALVEARQQRIALARLAASLRLPSGEEDAKDQPLRRPQRRGAARGAYRPRVVS